MKPSQFALARKFFFLISLAASTLNLSAYTATRTPDARFDVGISGSAVASGWEEVFPEILDTSTTATATQNGITITITADPDPVSDDPTSTPSVLDARDRGTAGTRLDNESVNPGGVFTPILQDFIFDNNNSVGDINTVEFTGLLANTEYKITSVQFEKGSGGPFTTDWYEGSTSGTLLGTWDSPGGSPTIAASDFVELDVTSDGTGTITLAAEATAGALRFCGFIVERVTPSSDLSYLIDFDSTFAGGPYTETGWTSLEFASTDTSGSVEADGVTFNASWTGGGARSRGVINNTPLTRDFGFTSDSAGITMELGEAGALPAGTWEVSMWSYDNNVSIAPAEVGYRVNGVVETVTGTGLPEDPIFPVATFQFVSDGVSSYEVFLRDDIPGVGQDSARLNAVSLKLVEPTTEYRIDIDSTNGGGPVTKGGWTSLTLGQDAPSGSVAEGDVTFSISGLNGSRTRSVGTTLTQDFGYASGASAEIIMELGSAGDIPAGTWEVSIWAYDGSAFVGTADVGYREDNGVDPAVDVVTDTSLPQDASDPITTFQFTSDGTSSYELFMRVAATETTTESIRFNAMTLRMAPAAVVKDDNTDNLDLGTSWVGGSAPGPDELATWDATVTGANTTVLGSDATWAGIVIEDPSGDVTINAGNTLTLNDRGTLIDMSEAMVDLNLNSDLVLLGSDIWEVATGQTLSVGGAVSGSSGIDLVGDGTVILSGANSYAGDTSVAAGTIQLGAADVIPNGSSKGNVSVSGLLDLNGNSETVNGLSGSGTIDNTVDSSTATLTIGDNDGSGTFSGVLQNSGSSAILDVVKTGSGTLALEGANTYDGTTTVSGGNLELGNLAALGNTTAITLAGGTRLTPTLDGLTVNAPITLADTGTATVDFPVSGVTTFTLDSSIDGDGNVRIFRSIGNVSSGTIILGGQSSYLGTTEFDTVGDVASGSQLIVQLGIADALPPTTVLTLDGGLGAGSGRTLLFDLNGFDQTLSGLQNVIDLVGRNQLVTSASPATLTINNSADYTFGESIDFTFNSNPNTSVAAIQGAISLVKSGGSTFTLTDSHTYTGTTSVNAGTLGLSNASLDSDITVADGASMQFTLGAPSSTSGTLDLSTGTVKIDGAVDNSSDYQLMTAATSISGSLTLDSAIPNYVLELRNGDTELWLAFAPAGYTDWASTNASTDANPSLDEDGDGVRNGVEYVLGGTSSTDDLAKLPETAISGGDMTFTFIRDQASVDGSTTLQIEVGTTLSSWPTVYAVGADTGSSSAGVTVEDNLDGTDTVTLTVTRDTTKKFARLNVTVPSP